MHNDFVRVILQLKPWQGLNLETKIASRIKWDGGAGILVYNAADKLAGRVPVSAVEQLTIESFPPASPANSPLRTDAFCAQ